MMISLIAAIAIQTSELPACDALEYEGTHVDCVLVTASGDTAIFTFEPGEWGETGTVTITGAGGETLLTEEFETESFFYPSLNDLDGNGFADILVPLITGNVNTEMLLIMSGEGGYTVASREISGHTFEAVVPGLFAVHSRGSAVDHYVSFHTWDGDALDLEASVHIGYSDEDTATCTLATGAIRRGEAFYCAAAMGE